MTVLKIYELMLIMLSLRYEITIFHLGYFKLCVVQIKPVKYIPITNLRLVKVEKKDAKKKK